MDLPDIVSTKQYDWLKIANFPYFIQLTSLVFHAPIQGNPVGTLQ